MRLFLAMVAALVLVVAPVADDDPSGICVGGMQIVACVPPEA